VPARCAYRGWRGLPGEDILLFFERWPAEAIILLAHAPNNESTILTLLNLELPDPEWFALNNILLAQHRMRALGLMLKDMPPEHYFDVWETIQPHGGIGGGIGDGVGIAPAWRFPDGFPPIALYRLRLFPCARCSVAAEGPRTVYYERNVVPLGDSVTWRYEPNPRGESASLKYQRTDYLVESLARIFDRPVQEVREAFFPRTNIVWKSPAQTSRKIEEGLKIQISGLSSLFAGAKLRRGIDLPSVQLTITPKVRDYRQRDKTPLPDPGPWELRLDLK